jgi:hypothetical protein
MPKPPRTHVSVIPFGPVIRVVTMRPSERASPLQRRHQEVRAHRWQAALHPLGQQPLRVTLGEYRAGSQRAL